MDQSKGETMTFEKSSNRETTRDRRTAKEIQHDIQQTRADMDLALDELANRFQPRRLLDEVVGGWKARAVQDPQDAARIAKRVATSATELVRAHPVPVLLSGAALVGWFLDSRRSHGGKRDAAPVDERRVDNEATEAVPAWSPGFDWSRTAGESQAAWNARVSESLSSAVSGSDSSPTHRLRDTAAHLVAVSGHAPRDIHRQPVPWGLNAAEWQQLKDCEEVASYDDDGADDRLTEKAAEAWESVKQVLNDTSTSAQERARKAAELISSYSHQARAVSARWQASARETARQWRESVQETAHAAGAAVQASARATRRAVRNQTETASQVARRNAMNTRRYVMEKQDSLQASVDRGRRVAKRSLTTAVDEYPLAIGAASFCAGLLIGVMMPSSRLEDELLGEKSDALTKSARETAREAIDRGREVAAKTASTAMAEAERQGLTPRHLVDKGQQVASAATDSVKSAIDAAQDKASDLAESVAEVANTAAETAKRQTSTHVAQAKGR